jgi:hypothetical protein
MTWPEAFALVGGAVAFFGGFALILWVGTRDY